MKSAYNKEVIRSITHSMSRFLAIAAIVALGTGFYAGLCMTAPDMKFAADTFYDGTALMDIRVLSTMGLSDSDVCALREIEGVRAIMPAYETDTVVDINSEQCTMRIHSLPEAAYTSDTSDGVHALADDDNYLNRPILTQGTWPKNPGECVLSSDLVAAQNVRLGDKVCIIEEAEGMQDALVHTTYTVVGFVSSSYYATSASLGPTSLGNGSIRQYMFVPEADFSNDFPYTEAFISVEGAAEKLAQGKAYNECVDKVIASIKATAPDRESARACELRSEAQKKLDEAYADYEEKKATSSAQLATAKNELDSARASIAENEQKLFDGQAEYDRGVAELARKKEQTQQQLSEAEQQIASNQANLDSTWEILVDNLGQNPDQAISWSFKELKAEEALLTGLWKACEAYGQQPGHSDDFYQKWKAELTAQKADIDKRQQSLNAAAETLQQYRAGVAQLEAARNTLAATRQHSEEEFAAAKQRLDRAACDIASGREQLEQAKNELENSQAEYERAKAQMDTQLGDAERQLKEAQRKIDVLDDPVWYVLGRDSNYGVVGFDADADRIARIAQVFPFIFFLVAALVALTTMTRMIEEERVLIGTYKALGYSRLRITMKYITYASLAGVAGSAIGIAVLSQVLPWAIMVAYSIVYFVPTPAFPFPVDVRIASLSMGFGVGVTLLATAAAAMATLRERPAALMLPRAPKLGKRILIERITPLWRRLSFLWKVTLRNLFRYKKRFVMTIIGVGGCTALLLTGLGLSNAINDIIDNQFGGILLYNTAITLDADKDAPAQEELESVLDTCASISDYTYVLRENMQASGRSDVDKQIQLIVPKNASDINRFIAMRTRIGHNPLTLDGRGAILSEKLAKQLDVRVGDTAFITEEDAIGNATGQTYEITVSGIMENYIYDYIFMDESYYKTVTEKTPVYSTIFAHATADCALRSELSETLSNMAGVKTIAYNDEAINTYRDMVSSVNIIVMVLIVAAALLAFVVLYNLTNINITERMREIATLKVLGFTPREIDAYIYKEVVLLSFIGSLVGLAIGVWMEGFVVATAEVDQVMFGRVIHPASFVIAIVLTVAFSVIVMMAMRRKLSRIDMVESLKSNE